MFVKWFPVKTFCLQDGDLSRDYNENTLSSKEVKESEAHKQTLLKTFAILIKAII